MAPPAETQTTHRFRSKIGPVADKELESENRSRVAVQEELKGMHVKLVAQEKLNAVADLAASVNQEIDNPLAIIVGNAQIMDLESSDLPHMFSRRIEAIVDAAKRISLISHKLLKIDRLVSENFLDNKDKTMLNLHRSAGVKI